MPNTESLQGTLEAKQRMNRTAIHPGAILQEEFLVPLGISASKLAQSTGIQDDVIDAIVAGKTGITEDVASLLATKLNTSSQFWMNLQAHYEARQKELAELTSEAQKLGLGY